MTGKAELKNNMQAALNLLRQASDCLPDVTHRYMFGCDALFARESIYAIAFRDGRIGLKLTELEQYQELLSLEGADVWRFEAEGKPVNHWVLIPRAMNENMADLEKWVTCAHASALARPKRPRKKRASRTGLNVAGIE
ncbi:MAG TPA: TfoX/Sxy family protein [Chloroflexia bacterium]|nr:TfoX/Sxy family protein [Chloroflexia bacterium]